VRRILALGVSLAACAGVQPRFPEDVQTALAHVPMRRLETDHFIIYYPEPRRAEVDRFLARATRCTEVLHEHALLHDGEWRDKQVIVMPDVAFNNAFVLPELVGYEDVALIPVYSTLDFSTEFGLPPDPGLIACHELTHYTHFQQVAGFWRAFDRVFGHIYTPQIGYDPWFLEGLATHYESALSPGVGRPRWPIFNGMFAAAYAGRHVDGGQLNSLNRLSHLGHHYLVGTQFMRFFTETYGERAAWAAIANNAHALTGFFIAGTFEAATGVPFDRLLEQFDAWCKRVYPVRTPPAAQHRLAVLGNDARYARGLDGTEAWVADDVDLPPRLTIRDATGRTLDEVSLVGVLPPRELVQADPLLVSGLSITADGRQVWLTVIDQGATFQIPRLLRWRRGGKLEEVATNLGPGGAIDPSGRVYYYAWVDGDRWSLAAWDVDGEHAPRMIHEMEPGTYVLTAQVSPDGAHVAASVWNGRAFVVWVIETATGRLEREVGGDPQHPLYDPSFTSDGHLMWLDEVDARFQIFVEGVQVGDAPYAALAAREAHHTIRFMDREGWNWELAEVPLPDSYGTSFEIPESGRSPKPEARGPISSDSAFSALDHLFFPQERAPFVFFPSSGAAMYGLVLGGGDRLGLQRWSLAGYTENGTHFGGDAAYLNTMLSPISILGDASFADWTDTVELEPSNRTTSEQRRTRDFILAADHVYRDTLTSSLAAVYTDDYTQVTGFASQREHVGGPQVAAGWVSGETTRYTGARKQLLVSGEAAYYPRELSTFAGDIADVGGSIGAVLPLPFGRRHTLSLDIRGRALLAHDDTGLLQVGGATALATLYAGSSVSQAPPTFDTARFPPNLRFVEPLRGYEDYAITTDRAALADADWRYPLIIDRGIADTLGFAPASFVRELDLDLFGAGAVDRAGDLHAAVGGALALRLALLRVPLYLTYQLARRLYDDRALTQLVGIALDQ